MCNICNQYNCCCNSTVVSRTDIISDQAGRDGLSAYESAIRTGVFSGTEAEYALWTKGQKGDPGKDGTQVWTNTEW